MSSFTNRPPGGNPGDQTNTVIELMEKALTALASRTSITRPISPDLNGVVQPLAEALNTIAGTFAVEARSGLAATSEVGRLFLDERLQAINATQLLNAAIAAGQIPTGGSVLEFTDIREASGARQIPWLDIIKEIVNMLLDLLPISPLLKKIIKEILRIIDKLLEGKPEGEV